MLSASTTLYRSLQKRYSRKINLDLNRINAVLKKFKNPHLDLKNPINILGSDGKMSVLTCLKYFLQSDNKKITTFTSPHLYDVRQRFWLNNNYISLINLKKLIKSIEQKKLKLTLFELLTCAYILAAKHTKNIIYNLVESGLLFKKDSTNLWKNPRAQIVTNINFQHQEWIKPKTISEICKQKLGYLSKNTVIYIGKQEKKTLKIIRKILKKNPSKIVYPNAWVIKKNKQSYYYKDKENVFLIDSKHIYSEGLIDNLGLAIKVALDLGVKHQSIANTIPKIRFEGRLQYLKKGKLRKYLHKNEKLLIDGCHSLASAKNLNDYLKSLNGPIYGICGIQKNKMPEKFIKIFKKTFKQLITVNIPNESNSLEKNKLALIAKKNSLEAYSAKNIVSALIRISSEDNKTIVIFGSLYLIGDVLKNN
jgi:dihydrofolate synthase/folylpolyglutamate synthase